MPVRARFCEALLDGTIAKIVRNIRTRTLIIYINPDSLHAEYYKEVYPDHVCIIRLPRSPRRSLIRTSINAASPAELHKGPSIPPFIIVIGIVVGQSHQVHSGGQDGRVFATLNARS
jgi:hypothetical protein